MRGTMESMAWHACSSKAFLLLLDTQVMLGMLWATLVPRITALQINSLRSCSAPPSAAFSSSIRLAFACLAVLAYFSCWAVARFKEISQLWKSDSIVFS